MKDELILGVIASLIASLIFYFIQIYLDSITKRKEKVFLSMLKSQGNNKFESIKNNKVRKELIFLERLENNYNFSKFFFYKKGILTLKKFRTWTDITFFTLFFFLGTILSIIGIFSLLPDTNLFQKFFRIIAFLLPGLFCLAISLGRTFSTIKINLTTGKILHKIIFKNPTKRNIKNLDLVFQEAKDSNAETPSVYFRYSNNKSHNFKTSIHISQEDCKEFEKIIFEIKSFILSNTN